MTLELIEFFIGLYMAATSLAVLLDSVTTPVVPGTKRSLPRPALFVFLVGVVLIVLAYFHFTFGLK
jgi:hypothetical protein